MPPVVPILDFHAYVLSLLVLEDRLLTWRLLLAASVKQAVSEVQRDGSGILSVAAADIGDEHGMTNVLSLDFRPNLLK